MRHVRYATSPKSPNVIEISARQHDTANRRITYPGTRMQFWSGFDLRAQVGRRPEQKPCFPIAADRNLRLRTRLTAKLPAAHGMAIRASAIPLGESSSGGRAEDFDVHQIRLQLCTHVGVNFAAEGNFFENRSCPNHCVPPHLGYALRGLQVPKRIALADGRGQWFLTR